MVLNQRCQMSDARDGWAPVPAKQYAACGRHRREAMLGDDSQL